MNAITITTPQTDNQIITAMDGRDKLDAVWAELFDVRAAVRRVDTIIAGKGSDQTRERHTRKSYAGSLGRFIVWAGGAWEVPAGVHLSDVELEACVVGGGWHRFPGPELMSEYITHLKGQGLKAGTINRHLAPVRHYLKALRLQIIPARGDVRDFVNDCKDWLLLALEEKPPQDEEGGNNLPAMYQHGTRLREGQVREIFASIMFEVKDGEQVEREMDLLDLRDLALLYVGFNTGLRDAELRRMTLSGIMPGEHNSPYQIKVRGKRGNRQPVPLDAAGHALIMKYVEAYNGGLAEDDQRRIGRRYTVINRRGKEEEREVPIFQALRKGGHYNEVGVNGFDPEKGMSKSTVWGIVRRRSYVGCGVRISPHDMRRTVAALARQKGMGFDVIKMILRHKSISTTERYVGNPPDLGKAMLSGLIDWGVGAAVA